MPKRPAPENPSTARQFLNVLIHEPPSFIFRFSANAFFWAWHKFILQKSHLVKNIHGYKLQLRLDDPGISRSLLLVGDREREHRYILEKVIKPGQTVLDLGANIGYYVLLERQLMKDHGRIIAVEPAPDNFQQLLENIKINGAEAMIECHHAAVATQDGTTRLYLSELSNVHSLIAANTAKAIGQNIEVPAISLNTLKQTYPNLSLIRMDIEGYEVAILESLIAINQTTPWLPDLLFELHPAKYDHPRFLKLLDSLHALKYRARFIASSNQDLLKQNGAEIIASIPTDGKIRHIARDLDHSTLKALAFNSRAVLLTAHN